MISSHPHHTLAVLATWEGGRELYYEPLHLLVNNPSSTYLMNCGANWLSLSLALVWASSTGMMYGTLASSTGGLKSLTMMDNEGASSLSTALERSLIFVGPCSGSRTMARRRLKIVGLRLSRRRRVIRENIGHRRGKCSLAFPLGQAVNGETIDMGRSHCNVVRNNGGLETTFFTFCCTW